MAVQALPAGQQQAVLDLLIFPETRRYKSPLSEPLVENNQHNMALVSMPPRESEAMDFSSQDRAFLGSLLPGIIHNWATPLSGVIGATQLLERRVSIIEELLREFDELSVAERDELKKQLERNRTNVEILSRNAQHLADLLQVLVYRITRGNTDVRDCFPLHELMRNELRFLEANLQFKHKVRKNLALDPVTPATPFCYGFVAAAVDEYVTYAIARHDYRQRVLEMNFSTHEKDGWALLSIAARTTDTSPAETNATALDRHLLRLRDDGWNADFEITPAGLCLELRRPPRVGEP